MKKQYNFKKPLIIALMITLCYWFLLSQSFFHNKVFHNIEIQEIVIYALQLGMIIMICMLPVRRSAKVKGIVAILMFFIIRLLPSLVYFDTKLLNSSFYIFFAFAMFYLVAAILAMESVKEVISDGS